MNLKLLTGRLLAVCTLSGFAIGIGLIAGYRRLEQASNELGPHSSALLEVASLETQLQNYVYLADLVL
ncbi:MAG: hypothetical protein FJ265_22745 [Planctomycetes bacterium]|nr:hypothetical protein [Planctomycetota bacterium]